MAYLQGAYPSNSVDRRRGPGIRGVSANSAASATPSRLSQQSAAKLSRTAQSDETIVVTGQVLDPAGKPVAGARVAVPSTTTWDTRLSRHPVVTATSDDQGRFRITYSKSQVSPFSTGGGSSGAERWRHAQVVASHPGFGLAFARWNNTDANGELILRLVEDDVPIDGRIVDLEGRPVRGLGSLSASRATRRQSSSSEARPESYGTCSSVCPSVVRQYRPDRQRFRQTLRITGIGRDRSFLYIQGETIGSPGTQPRR